jgi:hypothetical protein
VVNSGLDKINENEMNKFFSMSEKKLVLSKEKLSDFCFINPCQSPEFVYSYKDMVTISKKYIKTMILGVQIADSSFKGDPSTFVVPRPHFNMNKEWSEFCRKNQGLTLESTGVIITPISEFTYHGEKCF